MLCNDCKTIDFRIEIPAQPNTLFALLHRDHGSFKASLALGCDLCLLISGKLGRVHVRNQTCQELGAFMILHRFFKKGSGRDITSIGVESLLGNVLLQVFGPIPGARLSLFVNQTITLTNICSTRSI